MPLRPRAIILAAVLAATACGTSQGQTQQEAVYGSPQPQPVSSPLPEITPVETVAPALKATVGAGVTPEMLQSIKETPSVAHATAISLGEVMVQNFLGPALISVAAIDPLDFRPLSPQVTANAEFIWRALLRHRLILAHEEHNRLRVSPGSNLLAQGVRGRFAISLGGVAANGVPNWAGALVSRERGSQLGLGLPTLLVIGLEQGTDPETARRALRRKHSDIQFEITVRQRAFLTGAAAAKAFGSFSFTTNQDGTITPDEEWVKANIVSQQVPIFGSVRCHQIMFPQLKAALTEVENRGLASEIDRRDYGGCFVPRFIGRDPGRPLSMHAWGIAVDFNVSTNPVGAEPKMNREVVQIFESWGFRWGGRWSPPDGHHFELAAIVKSK